MKTLDLNLGNDSYSTREEADVLIGQMLFVSEISDFQGQNVCVNATGAVLTPSFIGAFCKEIFTDLGADQLTITGGSSSVHQCFQTAASLFDMEEKLNCRLSLVPQDTLRTIETVILAEHIGREIASHRSGASIEETFCRVMSSHNISGEITDQYMAWATQVSRLIISYTYLDCETRMAQRAVLNVLTKHLGATATIYGPWIEDETVTLNGEIHTLTGDACPRCRINPVFRGYGFDKLLCLDTEVCGWRESGY